jgi:hypothetical protein
MTSSTVTLIRVCEYADCDNPLIRRPNESHPHFARRKYCGQACMGAARRVHPPKPSRANPGLNSAPPPFQPRIENGVWRPNAPGWPAAPRIPQRNLQRTTA